MKYKWIVYLTINLCNGKFYIGVHKTIDPNVFDGYIGDAVVSDASARYLQKLYKKKKKNVPFVNAVVKYGYKNFKRSTLVVFDNPKEAFNLEAILVNEDMIKCKQCYNVALGGKISFNCIERRVYQFALNGNFLRSYKSITDAANANGISTGNLVTHLKGRQHTCGGYYWNYEKKFDYVPYKPEKQVCQYTLSGKFIQLWDSIKEATDFYHSSSGINRAIKNKSSCAGYQWRYFDGSYTDIEPYAKINKIRKKKQDGDIV